MDLIFKIFQQTAFQIFGKVVSVFSTFIILGIVTRNYGENGTGIFTLVLTYISIFMLVGDFGFNAHILKSYHGVQSKSHQIWNKLLGTRIVWSVVLAVLAIILAFFLPFSTPDFSLGVLISAPVIVAASIFVTFNLIFQNRLRYDQSVLAQVIGTLAALGMFLLITKSSSPLVFILIPNLLSWVFIVGTALFLLTRITNNLYPFFDLQFTKDLVKSSWPIALTLILNVIYFRADSFMIASMRSVSESGVYNLAFSIFQSALILSTFIMNSYYPLMLKSKKGIRIVGLALLVISLTGLVLTQIFAPLVVGLITGGGFEGSVKSLQILGLGYPAFFLSSLCMWFLISKGRYKLLLGIYTSGLFINLLLNFIYIPQYSFIAASVTTVVSEYLILLLLLASISKKNS